MLQNQPCSHDGHEPTLKLEQKRKQSPEHEDLTLQIQDTPIEKRARISPPESAVGSKEASDIDETDLPIEYWRKTGMWPRKLFQPDLNMSQELTKKRSSVFCNELQSRR